MEGSKQAGAPSDGNGKDTLTVMTRNLYLGADTSIVLEALLQGPEAVIAVARRVWAQIEGNDFRERAVALVDEIEEAAPDLIGLQEAVRLVRRSGGGEVEIDFLVILQQEFRRRGLPYTVLAFQENTSVTLPLSHGQEVQFTDRVAMVAQRDCPVDSLSKGVYRATEKMGEAIELRRGWIRVGTKMGGVPYHLVTTHLEIQPFALCQRLQTRELLNEVVSGWDGVTILLGDFNSNADGSLGDPSWTSTYESVLKAGFRDLWAVANPEKEGGLTCCFDPDLSGPASAFDQRIDFIFMRGQGLPSIRLVGTDPSKRTSPRGLWPSDHAGLVASIRL